MVGQCSVRVGDRIIKFKGGSTVNNVEIKIRAICELKSGGLLEGDEALMNGEIVGAGRLYDFKGGILIGTSTVFVREII